MPLALTVLCTAINVETGWLRYILDNFQLVLLRVDRVTLVNWLPLFEFNVSNISLVLRFVHLLVLLTVELTYRKAVCLIYIQHITDKSMSCNVEVVTFFSIQKLVIPVLPQKAKTQ